MNAGENPLTDDWNLSEKKIELTSSFFYYIGIKEGTSGFYGEVNWLRCLHHGCDHFFQSKYIAFEVIML